MAVKNIVGRISLDRICRVHALLNTYSDFEKAINLNTKNFIGAWSSELEPLSKADQCLAWSYTKTSKLVLAADADLYDDSKLKDKLDLKGQKLGLAEILLEAYKRFGVRFIELLDGDFAISIIDSSNGIAFIVRDHLGARPMYWRKYGNQFLFGSSIALLKELRGFPWECCEKRLSRFLCVPKEVRPETFTSGVNALQAGHLARIDCSSVNLHRWWNPNSIKKIKGISTVEAVEEVAFLTRNAIEKRLPANKKVGSHISGGVDSTLVTLIASESLITKKSDLAVAYTWPPPIGSVLPHQGRQDERDLISSVCEKIKVHLRFANISSSSIDSFASLSLEETGTTNLLEEWLLMKFAAEDNIEIMLSGWGGDEIFSSMGHGYFPWLIKNLRLKRINQVFGSQHLSIFRPLQASQYLFKKGLYPFFPGHLLDFAENLKGPRLSSYPSSKALRLNDEFDKPRKMRIGSDPDEYSNSLLLNGHIGERSQDWASWARKYDIQYRYPLTDRKLVEFLLSLPPEIRLGDGRPRYLAFKAFNAKLPLGVGKRDVANEMHRHLCRAAWLKKLKVDVGLGRFDKPCPLISMGDFKNAIMKANIAKRLDTAMDFRAIFLALRVYSTYIEETF